MCNPGSWIRKRWVLAGERCFCISGNRQKKLPAHHLTGSCPCFSLKFYEWLWAKSKRNSLSQLKYQWNLPRMSDSCLNHYP